VGNSGNLAMNLDVTLTTFLLSVRKLIRPS
jgi:hypothetical protein